MTATPDIMTVVCFGDSITGPRPRELYMDKFLKFSDLLQLMLEARMGLGRVQVLNRGWAGDSTFPTGNGPGAIHRLQEDVLAEKPQIAVILIGGNDAAGGPKESDQTRENLEAIVSRCRDAGINVLLLQYHVLPNPDCPEKAWFHLVNNNRLIAEVAGAYGVPVLDMGAAMTEAARGRLQKELVHFEDGVHLLPGGEVVFARSIFAKMVLLGWV